MSKSSWAERMTKTAKGEDIKKEYMNKPSYNKLLQQNIKLKKELSELQEAYNIAMLENNKLRKELKHETNTVWDLSKRLSDTEKELSDLKELILKTINIFEVALELKEVKNK